MLRLRVQQLGHRNRTTYVKAFRSHCHSQAKQCASEQQLRQRRGTGVSWMAGSGLV